MSIVPSSDFVFRVSLGAQQKKRSAPTERAIKPDPGYRHFASTRRESEHHTVDEVLRKP